MFGREARICRKMMSEVHLAKMGLAAIQKGIQDAPEKIEGKKAADLMQELRNLEASESINKKLRGQIEETYRLLNEVIQSNYINNSSEKSDVGIAVEESEVFTSLKGFELFTHNNLEYSSYKLPEILFSVLDIMGDKSSVYEKLSSEWKSYAPEFGAYQVTLNRFNEKKASLEKKKEEEKGMLRNLLSVVIDSPEEKVSLKKPQKPKIPEGIAQLNKAFKEASGRALKSEELVLLLDLLSSNVDEINAATQNLKESLDNAGGEMEKRRFFSETFAKMVVTDTTSKPLFLAQLLSNKIVSSQFLLHALEYHYGTLYKSKRKVDVAQWLSSEYPQVLNIILNEYYKVGSTGLNLLFNPNKDFDRQDLDEIVRVRSMYVSNILVFFTGEKKKSFEEIQKKHDEKISDGIKKNIEASKKRLKTYFSNAKNIDDVESKIEVESEEFVRYFSWLDIMHDRESKYIFNDSVEGLQRFAANDNRLQNSVKRIKKKMRGAA